ncbi:SRPBCC family protein [Sphingomonas sp. GB1N7]|uniref:SRPBCC family protein n=1 Tax=Parasphingomonas caseinilytica TaxID=3096158 RepID=UPI002FCA1F37
MTDGIRWPPGFAPADSPVHVVNCIETTIAPDLVWARLIHATRWPAIYANARDVRVEGGGADLFADARFRWKTFGVALDTRVVEFEPETRIAWIAEAFGIRAYHAWLITPLADGGCTILTEETQHGWVARIGRRLFPRRMEHWHQRWLEALAA